MTSTVIIRIGPIADSDGNVLNVYAPLSYRISREAVVFAPTDREGLQSVSRTLQDVDLACAPELAEAATAIGAEVRPLTSAEAELAADVALGLKPIAGVPEATDAHRRRFFFRALGRLEDSPIRTRLEAGALAQGEITGQIADREIAVGVTMGHKFDSYPIWLFSIVGTGSENEGDVDLAMINEPEYVRNALQRAYGFDYVPRLATAIGPIDRRWSDLWLPVLSAAIEAVAAIDNGGGHGASTPQTELTAHMNLLSL